MKGLNRAVADYILWKAKGFNPIILWHMRKEYYFVAVIWYSRMNCFYEPLIRDYGNGKK